jgi:hypothetical protein
MIIKIQHIKTIPSEYLPRLKYKAPQNRRRINMGSLMTSRAMWKMFLALSFFSSLNPNILMYSINLLITHYPFFQKNG